MLLLNPVGAHKPALRPGEGILSAWAGGDHLLRSSKCTNKAAAAILDFIARHDTQDCHAANVFVFFLYISIAGPL